jgi:hypothetical protein
VDDLGIGVGPGVDVDGREEVRLLDAGAGVQAGDVDDLSRGAAIASAGVA